MFTAKAPRRKVVLKSNSGEGGRGMFHLGESKGIAIGKPLATEG